MQNLLLQKLTPSAFDRCYLHDHEVWLSEKWTCQVSFELFQLTTTDLQTSKWNFEKHIFLPFVCFLPNSYTSISKA